MTTVFSVLVYTVRHVSALAESHHQTPYKNL